MIISIDPLMTFFLQASMRASRFDPFPEIKTAILNIKEKLFLMKIYLQLFQS